MDIQNAAAAGPSYGLLDVIFGTKPEEKDEADGQKFQPLMDMIKALKNKGEEKPTLEGSRTETETATGKDASEVRVVGIPELFASMALMQQQGMQMPREAMVAAKAEAMPQQVPIELGKMDPKLVNAMLKEKSLPPLNEAEMQLLSEVNAKMAKVDQKLDPNLLAGVEPSANSEPKAADSRDNAAAERFLQALSARGVDPEKLKNVEAKLPMAAPENFMTTESYLKMHEALAQQNGKKTQVTDKNSKMEVESDMRGNPAQLLRDLASKQEGGQEKSDLFGGAKEGLAKIIEKGDKKMPLDSTMPFAATLVQNLKQQAGVEAKDVFLSGMKPETMRAELMEEVTGGVHLNAMRGGGEMKLVIHPEEMGEVKLKIAAGRDGKIDVHITAENGEVAEMIRSGSKDLQASLGDHNLQLARFEVTVSEQSVSSLEEKGSLSEQLMKQNSQGGFQQNGSNSEDSRFSRWEGAQDQRQGAGFLASDDDNNAERLAMKPNFQRTNPARDGSRRLDVVA